ncbi:MAG: carboxypeptidase regulatory-like domain-containing protein [Pirellulales bacterium]|nr:carboxypeptidase regulatory-like domain-containing protein [Pirellulales bacterium]
MKEGSLSSNRCSARPIWLCGLVLALVCLDRPTAVAVEIAVEPIADRLPEAKGGRPRAGPADAVWNVALGSQGVLRGRVVPVPGADSTEAMAGLQVRLVRGQQTKALTTTGPQGEFALQNVPEGLYWLAVDGRSRAMQCRCRVWSPAAAPPLACGELKVPIGDAVVRGQGFRPFPIMSLRQAATLAGIAAGAIAAPAIYHNAKLNNRVPASP